VSSDPVAQQVIANLDHLLTCTSANLAGQEPEQTPEEILKQLGEEAALITEVYDDGPRNGTPSTVVRCVGSEPEVLRQGSIEIPSAS
jgi:tRNA A37 threonylcarbamoyladenosine synthetase subunit TsaC/SUA5/YrdC